VGQLIFHNRTELESARLEALCTEEMAGWATGTVTARIRYSRGADFSGTCYYADRRIFVNLGQHLEYPYRMGTHLARARTIGRRWYKPIFTLELHEPEQVVLFVFLHELYHLLVKRAGRNVRQKESMCDRFAAGRVVDRYGVRVLDPKGALVPRDVWDFQDVEGFVAAARDRRCQRAGIQRAARRPTDAPSPVIPTPPAIPPAPSVSAPPILQPPETSEPTTDPSDFPKLPSYHQLMLFR
jgi:hypothetical protein